MEIGLKWDFEGVSLKSFLEKAAKLDAGCSEGDVISFILNVNNFWIQFLKPIYRM